MFKSREEVIEFLVVDKLMRMDSIENHIYRTEKILPDPLSETGEKIHVIIDFSPPNEEDGKYYGKVRSRKTNEFWNIISR